MAEGSRLPLGIEADAQICEEELALLCALESYDLSQIRRRLLTDGLIPPSWVDEAMLEFRRYFGLIALLPGPIPMLSKPVDEVWHTCLLFTRLYADLCMTTVGRFVHHDPQEEEETETAAAQDAKLEFRRVYTRLFGPPGRLWG